MLSQFQQDFARSIEQQPDFEQWCVDPPTMLYTPDIPGLVRRAKLFCYYTKDGVLHLDRVSDQEVFARYTFPAMEKSNATSTHEDQIESGQAV